MDSAHHWYAAEYCLGL